MKQIDHNQRYNNIKQIAYDMWVECGCPSNKDHIFWSAAEQLYYEQYAIWDEITVFEFEVHE